MIEYKCGHTTKGIIILDSNPKSMNAYFEWADKHLDKQDLCFDCYLVNLGKGNENR
jgi:hypothetical protein